jgi:hypothetical protein
MHFGSFRPPEVREIVSRNIQIISWMKKISQIKNKNSCPGFGKVSLGDEKEQNGNDLAVADRLTTTKRRPEVS